MTNYKYREEYHSLTGDPMWVVEDISLALGGVSSLVEAFIKENNKNNYSLSIYDNLSGKTIEISCNINEMPKIVEYIYQQEKGTPLTFIGLNSLSESYVVGMSISMGRIQFGEYIVDNGSLKKTSE